MLCWFPFRFIARVNPGQLPKMAFSVIIMEFQFILFYLFNEVPYNTQVCHLMSMNGGQTLDLSYFQHIFILRVTPGH